MAKDNEVMLEGNVTRQPELRFTASGAGVCEFGMAVNRRWQNRQTQAWEEATSFFDISAWGQLGENIAESVGRGDRVTVIGRLEQQTWEDKKTGDKRSKIIIVADTVAPSLRYATASVVRNERVEGGRQQQPAPQAQHQAYDYEEEPFCVDAGEWLPGAWGHYPERMLGR